VLVRTEELNISGSLFRNKEKFARFVRKVTATNPTRGPWHYRSPSKILWRVIRGMLPHKVRHMDQWPAVLIAETEERAVERAISGLTASLCCVGHCSACCVNRPSAARLLWIASRPSRESRTLSTA